MYPRHPLLLHRDRSVLCVIDVQESLIKAIWEPTRVLSACRQLIEACRILSVPVIATTQYARGLGGLCAGIGPMPGAPIDKLTFSCAANSEFRERLGATGRDQVLLCGAETHICVLQTALDLVHQGYQVHCAADAVSSRTLERHKLGMEKIRDAGVAPCSAESAVFELVGEAGTPEFKAILPLVK